MTTHHKNPESQQTHEKYLTQKSTHVSTEDHKQEQKGGDNTVEQHKDKKKDQIKMKQIQPAGKTPIVLTSLGTEETELKTFFEQILLPRLRKQLAPFHDTLIPTKLIQHFQELLNDIEAEFRLFSTKLEHTTHSLRFGDKRGFKGEVEYLEHDLPNLKHNIETLVKEVNDATEKAQQEFMQLKQANKASKTSQKKTTKKNA